MRWTTYYKLVVGPNLLKNSRKLDELDSSTKTSSPDFRTISQVCPLFDTVIEQCPDIGNPMEANAEIVEYYNFEGSFGEEIQVKKLYILIRVQSKTTASIFMIMEDFKVKSLSRSLLEKQLLPTTEAQTVLRRTHKLGLWLSLQTQWSLYFYLQAFTNYLHDLSSTYFETQLLLFGERDHWSISDINYIV